MFTGPFGYFVTEIKAKGKDSTNTEREYKVVDDQCRSTLVQTGLDTSVFTSITTNQIFSFRTFKFSYNQEPMAVDLAIQGNY